MLIISFLNGHSHRRHVKNNAIAESTLSSSINSIFFQKRNDFFYHLKHSNISEKANFKWIVCLAINKTWVSINFRFVTSLDERRSFGHQQHFDSFLFCKFYLFFFFFDVTKKGCRRRPWNWNQPPTRQIKKEKKSLIFFFFLLLMLGATTELCARLVCVIPRLY